jgi:hypothetical protein
MMKKLKMGKFCHTYIDIVWLHTKYNTSEVQNYDKQRVYADLE